MRLFVAVPIPAAHRFHEVAREIQSVLPSAKVVPPENHHVTLRFLGDLPDPAPVQAAVRAALQGSGMQPVLVEGVGAFPNARQARVVWAGMQAQGLGALRERVVAATKALGQPEPDRPFKPHVTLARLDPPQDARIVCDAFHDTGFYEGLLREVILFRSHLGPQGPRYEAVERFPLS